MNMVRDIWIINGIPGAGKTTVARALAKSFERGVHIEGDRLQELIVSGGVLPGQESADEESRQIRLNVQNQCLLARSFAEAGFVPVIDYVLVSQARLDEYRGYLDGFSLHLVTLIPGVEVALERDRARPEKTVAHFWSHLDTQMRAEFQTVGLCVNNADLTVEETVARILQNADLARV